MAGYDRQWRKLREQVLREEPVCACGRPANTADHIVPLVLGGARLDRQNVRGRCSRCNYRDGARVGNRLRGERRKQARLAASKPRLNLGQSHLEW